MSTGERIYVQELTEIIQQLESERAEMIDVLVMIDKALTARNKHEGLDPSKDFLLIDVKTVLRNTGKEE